jgi:hypothetical protein
LVALPAELIGAVRRRLAAADAPLHAPATAEIVSRSEELLGWRLPDDVRVFFHEIANGGGGWFLGLVGGGTDDLGNTAVDLSLSAREPDPEGEEAHSGYVPRSDVLPIFYWGCATYSCVCADGTMINQDGWDWISDGRTFEEWLRTWASGTLTQPR